MRDKVACKTPSKASMESVASYGKKPVAHKTIHAGRSARHSGLKPASVVAVDKSKSTYTSLAASPQQLHEAAHAGECQVAAPYVLATMPHARESELADELLTAVAQHDGDVRELCEKYALKREELGRLTGFSLRALAEWAAGKLPSQPAKRRLQEVRRLLDALARIVKVESIPAWLHQRNPAFERLTPLQVIELGEIDRLWAMVHDLGSGQPE
jgi:hypothetical protein